MELKATKVVHVGGTDPAQYPLAKKKQSLEFLREKAHLRPRWVEATGRTVSAGWLRAREGAPAAAVSAARD